MWDGDSAENAAERFDYLTNKIEKGNELLEKLGLETLRDGSPDYNFNIEDEMLESLKFVPTPEHQKRLDIVARIVGLPSSIVKFNDFEIRFRQDRGRKNKDFNIRSPFGVEYQCWGIERESVEKSQVLSNMGILEKPPLGSIGKDPNAVPTIRERMLTAFWIWFPVARYCALPSCGAFNPKMRCSGCKEARYCSKEHQKEDWSLQHKNICKDPKCEYFGPTHNNTDRKVNK
jgi:hypothetical protein